MSTYAYQFHCTNPTALLSYNRLYVEGFVEAMNAADFVQHATEPGREPDTHGWSYGRSPRYFDGRVTTKRCSWVYARAEEDMPAGVCAVVYFTNTREPIGYLRKVPVGTPPIALCQGCQRPVETIGSSDCDACADGLAYMERHG